MRGWLTSTALGALLASGCGSDERPQAPTPSLGAEEVSLAAAPGDRVIVANVNGQPVYADCVERQAAAHGLDARAALDECIDFELLAQAADRAGNRLDPDVLDVREREAVRAMIDDEFAAHFEGPEDVPMEHVRAYYDEVKAQKYVRPDERRETQYARVVVPSGIPEGADEDLEARRIADEIYAALKHRTDLTEDEFIEEARKIAAPTAIGKERSAFSFPKVGRILKVYVDATWAIPRPGMIHPPIRTPYGWDVILLTQIDPPLNVSLEEATPEIRETIFEVSRMRSFVAWTNQVVRSKPEVDDAALARLAEEQRASDEMFGPAPHAPSTSPSTSKAAP